MRKWYPLAVIAIAVVVSAIAVPQMPDRVPVHWNMQGEVDRYGNPFLAGAVVPPLMVLIWMLLRALPRLDPKRENYPKFQGSYDLVVAATLTLMLLVHFMVLGGALGFPIFHAVRVIVVAIGVVLVIIGNVMPRTRQNWVFGLRTPWTLSNERVWQRSHRFGGYVLAAAGLLVIAGAFLPAPFNFVMLVSVTIVSTAVTMVYSYLVWREEAGEPPG